MIDSFVMAAVPIVYIVTILFYIYSIFTTDSGTRFRECYLTMAVGLVAEMILGGIYVLTMESDTIGYVIPPSYRIESFIQFAQIIAIAFLFMWLDLLLLYLKSRRGLSPLETNVIKSPTQGNGW